MARPAGGKVNKLTMVNQFALINLVQAEYTKRAQYDPDFAVWASEQLGFTVTGGNIQGVREQFNIASTLQTERAEAAEPKTRLDRLEAELKALRTELSTLKTKLGEV